MPQPPPWRLSAGRRAARADSASTRRRFIVALALFVVASAFLASSPALVVGRSDAAFDLPTYAPSYMAKFLTMSGHPEDSWQAMSRASEYLESPRPGVDVYEAVFFERRIKFQYPLSSLVVVRAVNSFDYNTSLNTRRIELATWASGLVTAGLTALIFLRALRSYAPDLAPRRRREAIVLGLSAAFAALAFYPITKAVTLGQIQAWMTCMFTLMVYLWMLNRRVFAGVVGGAICALKPPLGLLLLWALLRKRWGFAAAFAATAGAVTLVSIGMFGLRDNLAYIDVLRFLSRRGETYYPNQSLNGLLNRLVGNGTNLGFDPSSFPAFHGVVYVATLISSVLLIGWVLLWRRNEHTASSTIDLLAASLVFTMASPIAWEHHYGILVAVFAVLLPAVLGSPSLRRWALPVLAVAFVVSSNYFDVAQRAGTSGPATLVQSYLWFAAIAVLVVLVSVRHAATRAERRADETTVPTTPEPVPA